MKLQQQLRMVYVPVAQIQHSGGATKTHIEPAPDMDELRKMAADQAGPLHSRQL